MGPRTTMKEALAAELIYLRLRATGLKKMEALEATAIEQREQGSTPAGAYRDYKTVRTMINRAQEWRKETSARTGVKHDIIARSFEEGVMYMHGRRGETVVWAKVLAGSVGAHISPGGLALHIFPQNDDGGIPFGAVEYFAVPVAPRLPPPPKVAYDPEIRRFFASRILVGRLTE